MECVEAALKTSFRKEMGVKPSPQAAFDDLSDVNVQNVDFSVDDLLNFSDDDGFVVVGDQDDKEDLSSPSQEEEQNHHEPDEETSNDNIPSTSLFVSSVPSTEVSLPADELANLEWLSHFVEESFSEFSTSYVDGVSPPSKDEKFLPEPKPSVPEKPCFTTPIPAKARSKRARTGGRVWSLGSPSFTESSSSSTTSSSSSSSPSSPWLIYATLSHEPAGSVEKPAPKKAKKRPPVEPFGSGSGSGPATSQPPRRCSHCGVQKTPQWRTGPLGAKTLCNACGVRFKSGRLLPEYRPACSPTFSSDVHSNHHRKVLEMRRKKEALPLPRESGLGPPVVSSF